MRKWWEAAAIIAILTGVTTAGSHTASGYECGGSCGRSMMPDMNRTPYEDGSIDVVIVGSELEGLYLAARAKEAGLHPLVLEPADRIGGQLLRAQMLYLDGVYDENGKPLMQGEFRRLFNAYLDGKIRKLADFRKYVEELVRGIPIETGVKLGELSISAKRVAALQFTDRKDIQHKLNAKYVVDNSDAGLVAEKLGVPRLPGLEALYGASGREYMSATYMIHLVGVDWERFSQDFWQRDKLERMSRYGPETYVDPNLAYGFPPLAAAYRLQSPDKANLRGLNLLNQGGGEVLINALQVYDVDPSDPESVSRGMETARKELSGIRDHLRRGLVGFEQARLAREPEYLYIREYNHYLTEYVLQASDLLSGRMFWDNVSVGGYFLDVQGSKSNREGLAIGRPDKYGIPLRSYLLQAYDNVVLTGKMVGSTAAAYGSTRIQANGSLAAETIGLLMGEHLGDTLKTVTPDEMHRFHERLSQERGIELRMPGGTNRISGLSEQDVKDLNLGRVTLLPGGVVARHLPFLHVWIDGTEVTYKGVRPVIIEGNAWVPMEETFRRLGAADVQSDAERERVTYTVRGGAGGVAVHTLTAPLHVWNNHVLIRLSSVLEAFPAYKAEWETETHTVRILK